MSAVYSSMTFAFANRLSVHAGIFDTVGPNRTTAFLPPISSSVAQSGAVIPKNRKSMS